MAIDDLAGIDAIIEGLRAELNACPATRRGYQEAAALRNDIAVWKRQRELVSPTSKEQPHAE